ncbi:radical SAM/Cys-rich domain protein [Aspergillus tanneri]|uniref:Radical SAM core domain-containing protein n=1 Tax=Aspergillus tanneri TaxID=1220188 RepID=A0A5M9MIQ2_9EURO|nr:uncharacterized protein ATNIH1004_006673 [Aspergillus tanneri]KAA8645254.1 hypothetical protein ATNIH1004_006673 [Aspergillus tanneri]
MQSLQALIPSLALTLGEQTSPNVVLSLASTLTHRQPTPMTSRSRLLRLASTTAGPQRRLRFDLTEVPPFHAYLRNAKEREERKRKEREVAFTDASNHIPTFQAVLRSHGEWPLLRDTPTVFQINIGKFCNLNCRHCHVESGPTKTQENMDRKTVDRCLEVLKARRVPSISTVDITGGAPELNPHFRMLVQEARSMGKTVIDRCNLVVLFEQGQENLAEFLAEQGVNIVASLPCYTEDNTDRQRGKRVFDDSITALKSLNRWGFGCATPSTVSAQDHQRLDLVYNPIGPSLPAPQHELETAYRQRLWDDHGVSFNSLYTLTNMPIKRFADTLLEKGEYAAYMELLANSFNISTVDRLMCRYTVNVSWDGDLYDCDFNSALQMGSKGVGQVGNLNIWQIGLS